jgi:hypothetical protein
VAPAVAGQEGHPPAADVADRDGRGRRPVRGVDGDLDRVVEERVEAGPAEDADGRPGSRQAHAILLSDFLLSDFLLSGFEVLDEESDDDESDDDEDDDESDEEEPESRFLYLLDPLLAPLRLSVL